MNQCSQKKSGAPSWMVTFADMMALLLTFFVLLLSVSTTDVVRYRAVAESISVAFGGGMTAVIPVGSGDNIIGTYEQGSRSQFAQRHKATKKFVEQTLAKEIKDGVLEVEWQQGQMLIRFPERVAFDTASSQLHARFSGVLRKIGQALSRTTGKIIVAGHTDNRPINNYRYRSNWDLSSARAVSVIHALTRANPDLPAARFVAQGLADTQPMFPNTNREHRAANRRVELTVTLTPKSQRDAENNRS